MLSYRHSYHAGNHADVLKHIVLVEILEHLIKKDSTFDYIDSHAGAGLYDLKGTHGAKLQEYKQGIAKLNADDWPELARYLSIVDKHNKAGKLDFYPGSPLIAADFMRKQDRSWLYELHPNDAALLLSSTANRKSTRVMREDGFKGVLSLLPPVSRRALVLMDPSYEIKTDYAEVFNTIEQAYSKFSTGTYALWYPVVDRKLIDTLERRFARSGIRNVQQFELGMAVDQFGTGMSASGMMVVNPPWTLLDKMSTVLPKLVETLGGEGSFYKCEQLVAE